MFGVLFKSVYKSSVDLVRVIWSRLVLTSKKAGCCFAKLPGSKRSLDYSGTAKVDSCSIQEKRVVCYCNKDLINSHHMDNNKGSEV